MQVHSSHFSDSEGNPSGGTTHGIGFAIGWQCGPLGRDSTREEPNGAFVEDIITAAIDRLEYYQGSKFANGYNENAIKYLNAALHVLNERTADREHRAVEGTHAV